MKLSKKYEEMSKRIVKLLEQKEAREGRKFEVAFEDEAKTNKNKKKVNNIAQAKTIE